MSHTCHWPRCESRIPPRLFMCSSHWRRLPRTIKAKILKFYVPGQEVRKDPSQDYISAAQEARVWAQTLSPRIR